MRISVLAPSVSEALTTAKNPTIGGIVLESSALSADSTHQFRELCVSARERHQTVHLHFSELNDALHSQLVSFWNQSIYLVMGIPYSKMALDFAHFAKTQGLSVQLSGITTVSQLHNALESGATGVWLPLQQLDQRLERSSEDLLNRGRAIADQHATIFDIIATDLSDLDHLAYALEYGADGAVVSPQLLDLM